MILNSEMSRKGVKQVKKIIRENKQEVLRVLRVDQNQGYIDLTRKQIKPDEIKEKELDFSKLKTVYIVV
jgi:translation initiation factor 2 subunit 1